MGEQIDEAKALHQQKEAGGAEHTVREPMLELEPYEADAGPKESVAVTQLIGLKKVQLMAVWNWYFEFPVLLLRMLCGCSSQQRRLVFEGITAVQQNAREARSVWYCSDWRCRMPCE